MSKDKTVQQVAHDAIAQAKAAGMDADDQKWMAVGAVNRAARAAGVIGEELTAEMNAASQTIVKQEQKKRG